MLGGFWADFGSIWGRFSVLEGSWDGLGWVLGGLGVANGAQDRFLIDLGSILRPVLGPQTDQNRPKIDAKMHSNCASVFGSIFERFLMDFGVYLGTIFGSCWASSGGSATYQKSLKTNGFLMNFHGSGGRSWHHFRMFLGCLFQDRFLIVLGSVLGSILEPFGLPNGVYVEGFGGSGLGSILGWFLGGSGTPPKFKAGRKLVAI